MSLVLSLQLAGGESVGDSKPTGRTVLCGCGYSCGKDGRRPDLGLGTYQATWVHQNTFLLQCHHELSLSYVPPPLRVPPERGYSGVLGFTKTPSCCSATKSPVFLMPPLNFPSQEA
jgi:hypothetical protein